MENALVNFPKLRKLILLFPLLFLIHDLEEIFTVEKFLRGHSELIPLKITSAQFAFAFLLLWLAASAGCYQAFKYKRFLGLKPADFLFFLVPGILLANGIGHLIQFLILGSYVPGLVTSIIIIFPYSYFVFRFLAEERILTVKKAVRFFVLGFILQGPLALSALLIAKAILS